MSKNGSTVLYQINGACARITLNRPEKRNALSDEMIAGLKNALRRADDDDDVRSIILDGSGADFCSGADLEALRKISKGSVQENLDDARSLMELFMLIRAVRVPVIAAVRGRALAGGCGLALATDLVLAGRSARFGFPEVKIGFVPAMVMVILRRNVSEKRALELLLTGDQISAEDAERGGLINHVFDDATFDADVEGFVRRFEKTSKTALSLTKRCLYQMDSLPFDEALSAGADINVTARLTEDCQKGIARFLQKE